MPPVRKMPVLILLLMLLLTRTLQLNDVTTVLLYSYTQYIQCTDVLFYCIHSTTDVTTFCTVNWCYYLLVESYIQLNDVTTNGHTHSVYSVRMCYFTVYIQWTDVTTYFVQWTDVTTNCTESYYGSGLVYCMAAIEGGNYTLRLFHCSTVVYCSTESCQEQKILIVSFASNCKLASGHRAKQKLSFSRLGDW